MSLQSPSPLQEFLHYYSVESNINEDTDSNSDFDTLLVASFKHFSSSQVAAFIAFAEYAVNFCNDFEIQEMFKNHNLHFSWRSPDAAKHLLEKYLLCATQMIKR